MSRVCVDRPQLGEIFPRWDVDENTRGPRERRRGREGGREGGGGARESNRDQYISPRPIPVFKIHVQSLLPVRFLCCKVHIIIVSRSYVPAKAR